MTRTPAPQRSASSWGRTVSRLARWSAAVTAAALTVVPLSAAADDRGRPSVPAATAAVSAKSALPTAAAGTARRLAPARPQQGAPAASRAATELACSVITTLRLCTHGNDALRPGASTAAGEGSSQQTSTANTRLGCYGDGRSGPRIQAVYARPATAPDRLPSLLASFRGWAGAFEKAVNDSAHQTKGARHVRFATTPTSSGCTLDVLSLALPAEAFRSFSATVSALQQQGLDAKGSKYLVWSDAAGYCGIASMYDDAKPGNDNLNNGAFPTYARVDKKCWGYAENHEVVHMLGGVQKSAPHATAGWHCRDGNDLMCYDDGTAGSRQVTTCPSTQSTLLDCGNDDYFSTSPAAGSWLSGHWNLAGSSFLSPAWTDPAPAPTPAPADRPQDGANLPADPGHSPSPSPSPKPLLPLPLPTQLLP